MQSAPVRTAASGTDLDWNTLLSQLNLQGMARELAKNSVLASFSEGRVVLNLAASVTRRICAAKSHNDND